MASLPQDVVERPISEPSLADLVRTLVADIGHLLRTELRLARSEVRSNVKAAAGGAIAVGAGIVLMLGAVFTLLAALVGWLTPQFGAGLAALIVGLGTAVVAMILIVVGGRRLSPTELMPDRSAASVREGVEVLKGD